MATSFVRSEVDIFALVLMDKGEAQFNWMALTLRKENGYGIHV
jgi:hypothetical protein